jgi:BirA family biotin operon repressor/biotin-[acetyl-CoA-carboxylase] ligase
MSLLDAIDSSNAFLLQLPVAERHGHAVLAEQQTAGRGRRGKTWQSPPGSNIYLSLGWNFQRAARDISCLSLAVGVAVVRALESQGITGLGLKWPNDIQAGAKKLGGILLESKPAADGGISVVIGIGINVAMPAAGDSAAAIDQPWTSVAEITGVKWDSGLRDRLAGAVLEQLLSLLGSYGNEAFEPFRADWQRLDLLLNQAVTVFSAEGEIHGHALGIDQQGNLRVAEEFSRGQQRLFSFNSAEVSVRRAGSAGQE